MRNSTRTIGLLAVCLLFTGSAAHAAEIRVLASNGIKAAMEVLEPQFEKASGDTLTVDYSTAATLRERIAKGEAFDVAILTDEVVDALIKSGQLSPAMRTELAAVGIGVGYHKGAAKPDVRTAASLKSALLSAKSIAYTGNGASRPAIDAMIQKLGIAHDLQAKLRLTPAGAAPASVGKGESDLVLTLVSEILPEPNVELAGPLPADFQSYLGFSAAAPAKPTDAKAVRAFISFLDGTPAGVVYKAKGMDVR